PLRLPAPTARRLHACGRVSAAQRHGCWLQQDVEPIVSSPSSSPSRSEKDNARGGGTIRPVQSSLRVNGSGSKWLTRRHDSAKRCGTKGLGCFVAQILAMTFRPRIKPRSIRAEL